MATSKNLKPLLINFVERMKDVLENNSYKDDTTNSLPFKMVKNLQYDVIELKAANIANLTYMISNGGVAD